LLALHRNRHATPGLLTAGCIRVHNATPLGSSSAVERPEEGHGMGTAGEGDEKSATQYVSVVASVLAFFPKKAKRFFFVFFDV
jgi:hypothetical protein